jgi:predicted RNA-binding protein with EMAP domain
MTNQQIAQEVLYSYMDVERDLSQPKILIHTLKKLRELMTGEDFSYDWGNMTHHTWDDALNKIDAVCDELEQL